MNRMSLSRRAFIKLTGTTMVCTCIGALGASGCASNPTSDTPAAPAGSYRVQDGRVYVTLSEMGTLLGVGGAVKLTLGDASGSKQRVIIVRPSETDYRVFADACTHNGKELNYLHREGLLACWPVSLLASWLVVLLAYWQASPVAPPLLEPLLLALPLPSPPQEASQEEPLLEELLDVCHLGACLGHQESLPF